MARAFRNTSFLVAVTTMSGLPHVVRHLEAPYRSLGVELGKPGRIDGRLPRDLLEAPSKRLLMTMLV